MDPIIWSQEGEGVIEQVDVMNGTVSVRGKHGGRLATYIGARVSEDLVGKKVRIVQTLFVETQGP